MTRSQRLEVKKNRIRRKKFLITFLMVLILLVIRVFIGFYQDVPSNTAKAEVLKESIALMSEKSAINLALQHEKKLIEAEELKQQKEIKSNKKIAYLTFDDGPSKNTLEILDILKEYNIKATFFVIGNLAEKNPDIINRIYKEGHALGNHSYSHKYKKVYKNTTSFLNEIRSTERVLKEILGEDFETNIIRFPGGSFGEKKAPFRKVAIDNGYMYYDWNALNGDAEGHNISKNKLFQRFKNTSKGKKKLIILMHDMESKKTTVEILPDIIEYLQQNGYEFNVIK
ncbi:peptidoglycan/xylan/chitin deacetylase (PgdA/CDA1 family) [Keratinibaculum paraultunense]|uniref:Peptidoglycan/xylan/chitin deacetylase (PgdA/CDA1 family) n=1 Tax=Keratinibaculum paraultunense TaxID=1278232 RepID=A0A4R3KXK7_9FIRM|nr:polysaccharide deacetylase family protein [Keratinibaculum paraultunense]QQY78977.1 polysaccharide deacetylase [Keratinibaculum paraultunense]TCS90597.1 peptidoglycan/xylan/chitin deacetylase (PgdA/CDA1 family) [Keratinibaculum paraultunense]